MVNVFTGIQVSVDSSQATRGARQTESAFNRISNSADRAGGAAQRFNSSLTRLNRNAGRVASLVGLGSAIGSLGVGFTGIIAARSAVSVVSEFGEAIATVQGVTGASAEEVQRFIGVARELGATTRFTATQAAQGLVSLSRAGLDVEDSTRALSSVLNLAQGALIDLGRSADIVASSLAQFNLGAEESARVADVLTNTSTSTNTTVNQLAEALKLAGPIASQLGISIEETSAALGVLANSGIRATLAGTNLRGILLGLTAPSTEVQKAIEAAGLSLSDLDIESRGLTAVLKTLADAQLGAEEAGRIFQRRNTAAALTLQNNVDAVEGLIDANEDAAGAAAELARIQDDTLRGSFLALRSAIEEVALSLGDQFGGSLRGIVDTVTETVRIFAGVPGAIASASKEAIVLAESIRRATDAVLILLGLGFAARLIRIAAALRTAAGAAALFRTAISPVGAILVGIGVAAVSFIDLSENIRQADIAAQRFADRTSLLEKELVSLTEANKDLEFASNAEDRLAAEIKIVDALSEQRKEVNEIADLLRRRTGPRTRANQTAQQVFGALGLGELIPETNPPEVDLSDFRQDLVRNLDGIRVKLGEIGAEAGRAFSENLRQGAITRLTEGGGVNQFNEVVSVFRQGGIRAFSDVFRLNDDAFRSLGESFVNSFGVEDLDVDEDFIGPALQRRLAQRFAEDLFATPLDQAFELIEETTRRSGLNFDEVISRLLGNSEVVGVGIRGLQAALNAEIDQLSSPLDQELPSVDIGASRGTPIARDPVTEETRELTRLLESQIELLQQRNSIGGEFGRFLERQKILASDINVEEVESLFNKSETLRRDIEINTAIEKRLQQAQNQLEILQSEKSDREIIAELQAIGIDLEDERLDKLREQLRLIRDIKNDEKQREDATERLTQQAEEANQALESIVSSSVGTLTNELFSAAEGAKSFAQALEDAFRNIVKLIAQQVIQNSVRSFFSQQPVQSAKGNVFNGGNVLPFQRGGVIDGPILFPLSGNRTGLAGEAGPEAILPLTRGRGGRLGVEASGQSVNQVSVSVNLGGSADRRTADRFGLAGKQVASDIQRALG